MPKPVRSRHRLSALHPEIGPQHSWVVGWWPGMASLTVALPLAMAAIISLAVFALMVPVAGQFSGLPQAPQPPCRAPSTQSAALQDAVEGIAGLMQRFEDLQPQIAQLPAPELQQIAQPAQKLHERFENMQKKLVAINGNAGPELEEASLLWDMKVFKG